MSRTFLGRAVRRLCRHNACGCATRWQCLSTVQVKMKDGVPCSSDNGCAEGERRGLFSRPAATIAKLEPQEPSPPATQTTSLMHPRASTITPRRVLTFFD